MILGVSITLFSVMAYSHIIVRGQDKIISCKPLHSKGNNISCTPPMGKNSARNNCTTPQTVGTAASYSCKPYFVHYESSKDGQMLCRESGEWSDMEEFDRFECMEDCGRRLVNPKPLIVNGKATNSSSWPWHATIFRKSPRTEQWLYICGGTIVQKSTVLTAAHCVTDQIGSAYPPRNFTVMLGNSGTNYTANQNLIGVQVFQVRRIYVSEYYDPRKEYQGDIALLHIDGDIAYTDSILPACLPTEFAVELNEVKAGSIGHVVGYGVDEKGSLSNSLKHASLEVKSHSECFIKLQRTLTESQLCAGGKKGSDEGVLCNGDSGGGFFVTSVLDYRYHIQGVVSTGDPDVRKGVCQNYAVFIRIFPFLFWIRDIIQRISGDPGRKVDPSQKYPFVQIGRERTRAVLTRIPREWENRVTLMKLENVDIGSDILIKSLEHARSLRSLHFSRVKFLNAYGGRKVILPLLTDVYLDILEDYPELSAERIFPEFIRKDFLEPFIFFSKSVENRDLDVGRIVQMNINVEIRMHIFKLIKVNHTQGIISLSQIPFANEILNNSIFSNFKLRQLGLSKCLLDVSYLKHFPGIEKLVLDNVAMSSTQLLQILPTLKYLKELTLIGLTDAKVYLTNLPISLTFLSLTDTLLGINIRNHPLPAHKTSQPNSDFIFPDEVSERSRDDNNSGCPLVETFYCHRCLISKSDFESLKVAFPSLKQIWINTNNHHEVSFLDTFKKLQIAFAGSEHNKVRIFKKTNSVWTAGNIIPKSKREILNFRLRRFAYFWTSEGDYTARNRLNFNEVEALKTGNYHFNGGLKLLPDGTSPLPKSLAESSLTPIPFHIQDRINTMEIESAEITSDILVNSLLGARNLRFVKLTNISLQDILTVGAELPRLEEYSVHISVNNIITRFSYTIHALIKQYLFIAGIFFKEYLPGTKIPLDYKKNILSSSVKKMFGRFGHCVVVYWNQETGELVSDLLETNDMLKNSNKSHLVKKFSYKYWPLDAKLIPQNITHLNLNFAVVDVQSALLHINRLEDLKLINVRVHNINTARSYKKWEWPILHIPNLLGHSESLKYLAVERAHIRGYRPGFKFTKLTTLFLESCTLEPKIIEEFVSIFPKIEEVVILGSSTGNPIKSSDDAAERLLILILKNSLNLLWIQGRVSGNIELRGILTQRGCKIISESINQMYFTLTMFGNEWECKISSVVEIQNTLLEMKGFDVFGLKPECHANTYVPVADRHSLAISEGLVVGFLQQWRDGIKNFESLKRWIPKT